MGLFREFIEQDKRILTVYRMMTEDTVEEKLFELQNEKVRLHEMMWNDGDETVLIELLKNIVKYRADEFVSGSLSLAEDEFGKIIAEEDIEDYLEKCESKTKEMNSKYGRIKDRIDQKED